MTLTHKKLLLASAAVVVMGLGLAPKPALAFDELNWTWDKTVTEDVVKTVNVNIDSSPTGMLELEKIQMQIGDVTATSTVTNVTNNPPGPSAEPAPEPAPTTFTLDLKAKYDDNQTNNPITSVTLLNADENGLELSNASGHVDNNKEKIYLTFDLTVPAEEPAPEPIAIGDRLAIDLPKVNSEATAVGNNQNIESSVAIQLHDGQYLFGGFSEPPLEGDNPLSGVFDENGTGNSHSNALANLVYAGSLGLITPATVSADSTVSGILNASVDSKATAVGNNMSIELNAVSADDAFMIADVTQFSYADVTANSLVDDVTIEGYSEFGTAGMGPCGGCLEGEPQIPLVNSVATAVGNNFSVKITSPAP